MMSVWFKCDTRMIYVITVFTDGPIGSDPAAPERKHRFRGDPQTLSPVLVLVLVPQYRTGPISSAGSQQWADRDSQEVSDVGLYDAFIHPVSSWQIWLLQQLLHMKQSVRGALRSQCRKEPSQVNNETIRWILLQTFVADTRSAAKICMNGFKGAVQWIWALISLIIQNAKDGAEARHYSFLYFTVFLQDYHLAAGLCWLVCGEISTHLFRNINHVRKWTEMIKLLVIIKLKLL